MKIKQCLSAFIWLELGEIDKGMNEKYKEKLSKREKAKLMKVKEELNNMRKNEEEKENSDEYKEEYEDDEEEDEEKNENNKNDDIFEESKEYLDFKEEEEHRMFEEKYKLFLSVYTDENVTLHQDEDMPEEDKDLSIHLKPKSYNII